MLEGIRVLDFSQYLPGPYASLRLADKGAEIIKVEALKGDPARRFGYKKDRVGLVFLANNRNKKSVALNLKEKEGKRIALELMKNVDVVIESFRPGVMERLGLGYEEAKKVNDKIIYCSITGFGQNTSYSHYGSHDLNIVALSGVLSQLKDKDGRPIHPTITLADLIGGMAAAEEISAALIHRFRNNEGKYIDISMIDCMVSLLNNHVLIAKEKGIENGVKELSGSYVCYHIYETKDGRYMSLAALEPKFWENFCHAIGRDGWVESHMSEATDDNPIYKEMKKIFKSYTLEEWLVFMKKVDCCLSPVLEINELEAMQLIKERGLFHSSLEGYLQVATTYDDKFQMKEMTLPKLGEHTEQILREWLNYDDEKLNELKEAGVIFCEEGKC